MTVVEWVLCRANGYVLYDVMQAALCRAIYTAYYEAFLKDLAIENTEVLFIISE
jgi:hypothetical protein